MVYKFTKSGEKVAKKESIVCKNTEYNAEKEKSQVLWAKNLTAEQ